MPELEIKIKATGEETLGDIQAGIKAINAELKKLSPTTKEFVDLSKKKADAQNRVNRALKLGWSESAKMKDAYFKTGLEVRQLFLQTGILSGGLGKLGDAFSSQIINAIQFRKQMELSGIAISTMATAGIAAVAGGIALIGWLSEAKEKAEKAKIEIRDLAWQLTQLRFENIDASLAIRIQENLGKISLLQAGIKKPTTQQVPVGGGLVSPFKTVITPLTLDEIKANIETEIKIEELKRDNNALTKANLDKEHENILQRLREGGERDVLPPKTPFSLGSQFAAGSPLADSRVDVSAAIEGMRVKGLVREELSKSKEMVAILKSGAQQFSNTLIDALVHGKDLASSIGTALLGILVNVGTSYLTGGISSVLGIASSRADTGTPTPVLSAQRAFDRSQTFGQPRLIAKIAGTDLLVMLDRAKPQLVGRTY